MGTEPADRCSDRVAGLDAEDDRPSLAATAEPAPDEAPLTATEARVLGMREQR